MATQSLKQISTVSLVAGLLYASWPLGPVLNPAVAHEGLASALEGKGQPYNWFFIGADIVSSLLVMCVAWLLWRRHHMVARSHRGVRIVLYSLLLFGLGTISDALLPISCEPTLQRCPDYHHDHLLLLHGLVSIIASLCLFIALLTLWWQRRKDILLSGVMAGYVLFLVLSVISISHSEIGNESQHYYLTLCGVCLALVPYLMERAYAACTPRARGLH